MKIITDLSLTKDLILISIPLISVVYYLFLKKMDNIKKIKDIAIIFSVVAIVGILIALVGGNKNFKAIDSNIYNKMPIPKEKIMDVFGEGFDVARYNDDNHIVLPEKEIKEYDLCDIYYIKRVVFTKNIFYSFGDILISIGTILFSFSFSIVFILTKRFIKLTKVIS